MLNHYPFANNRSKQPVPNALNTIETYSQISRDRAKPNFHKRNASEIIVPQSIPPKASFELSRRGSVVSKTPHNLDLSNSISARSTSLLNSLIHDEKNSKAKHHPRSVLSNITNAAKIRDPSALKKKGLANAKKRIQLQNVQDNSIISNVNTPHFKNIAKSSTSKNDQLFEKITSSVTPSQRYSCVVRNSSSDAHDNIQKSKENKPPSSKPKRHSRNKSLCLEKEQSHLVFANNPLTTKNISKNYSQKDITDLKKKQTLSIKKVPLSSSDTSSKLTYAQIIKEKKKGKSSLQELIEKQLQQKVLQQQKLAQDLSEKNCTATTSHTLETAHHHSNQENFRKQLKTNIESTPKMQTKVTRSVPTEYNNILSEIARHIPKSPQFSQQPIKKRNNSQTISHDLDVKARRPGGHKRNSHSMSITPVSPIKKKQDPHASFATEYHDQRRQSDSQGDFSIPVDENDACLRENLINPLRIEHINIDVSEISIFGPDFVLLTGPLVLIRKQMHWG